MLSPWVIHAFALLHVRALPNEAGLSHFTPNPMGYDGLFLSKLSASPRSRPTHGRPRISGKGNSCSAPGKLRHFLGGKSQNAYYTENANVGERFGLLTVLLYNSP